MAGHNRQLSILAMNVNGLNAPIKRHSIANWVKKKKKKKQGLTMCCLQETHLINIGLKSKGIKMFSKQTNGPHK
jgi:exonuclease III